VKDLNGNALNASRSWTFKTVTPPETTIDPATGPTGVVASTSASFAFSSSKPNSTFKCSLDGSTFADCASPRNYPGPLSQGAHTFQVRAIDASGIQDPSPASRNWKVDTVAPETSITAKPDDPSNNATPSFSFSSNETNSSFQCSIDGGTYSACTSPKSLSTLSDGSHTFSVKATDAAGNSDQSAVEYTWMVDRVAPETSIDSSPDAVTNSTSASFDFSSEAGSTFECKLDGGSYASCNSPRSYSGLGGGFHTFSVRATDGAGNTDATEATYTWMVETIVDDVAPTVLDVSPAHQATGISPSTNVTATFSEDMNPSSISSRTFKLFGAGNPVTAQVTYDQASRTATLNPAQDLEAGATYIARIVQDVHVNGQYIDGVTDLAGNTINKGTTNGDITWYFTVEAPPGVVTAAPKTLNLSPDVWCSPRQEMLTVTNRTPATVTFADVSITGPDAAYFSDNARSYILTRGPFAVLSGNYVIDAVTFSLLPNGPVTDRQRSFQATLTYKDGTGATIGNPVELRATTNCVTFG
jgi:hypothetical protein